MEINICPDWLLRKLRVPMQIRIHVGLFISSLVVLGLTPLVGHVPHFCLMQRFLGLPCPGCGILTSLAALIHFDFSRAWNANPVGILIAALVVLQVLFRPVAFRAPRFGSMVSAVSSRLSQATIAVLLFFWISKILSGGWYVSRLLP